jgi:hypothetical protein
MKWQCDRFFPEYFGFPLSVSFHRCSITWKNEKKKLTVFITGLHKKPQGCGASIASAARSFTTTRKNDIPYTNTLCGLDAGFSNVTGEASNSHWAVHQWCTNSRHSVVRATTFGTVASNSIGSSVWNLLQVALLALRIWRWLLGFWKICNPNFEQLRMRRISRVSTEGYKVPGLLKTLALRILFLVY